MASDELTMAGSMGFNSGLGTLIGQQNAYHGQMNVGGEDLQSYYEMVRRQQEYEAQKMQARPVQARKPTNPDDRLIVLLTEE